MLHNMPGCIQKFRTLMGDNFPKLGLEENGEAAEAAISVMHDYEIGGATTDVFIDTLLPLCRPGTTREDILDAWLTMHDHIPAERIRIVQQLAERYPLYLLSNNNEAHWGDVCAHYPELVALFRRAFLSNQLHVGKPDPRIFAAADEAIAADYATPSSISYNPSETIFVDDLEANCEAARRHGWQACTSLEKLVEML